MRFTDSPVIDLPVAGAILSFEQDNNSFEVGTSVWPCSLVLVKFAERWLPPQNPNPYSTLLDFSNKRAIELGAGCGPAGLGLSRLGLSDLLLTDIPTVLPALRRNLRRNRPHLTRPPKIAQLHWNSKPQLEAVASGGTRPFDLVIVADVVYMEESAVQLINAMDRLVGEDGVVLLGYQLRSPEAHRVFWDGVVRVFPVVEKVPHEHLHPEYAYEEADVYVLRRRQ